jgi:endonuclease/exonuclease/phosphatase family metal-dependent hydrolase
MQSILRIQSPTKRWFIPLLLIASVCTSFKIGKRQERSIKNSTFTPTTPRLLSVATEGQFSVITYNVAGLPEIISSAVTSRASSIAEIGRRLNNFDIVHVQEDFDYNTSLYASGNNHPYRSTTKGPIPFGDGLNTLSKFPISEVERVEWTDCTGADCFTPKGFTRSRIQIAREVYIDFYNVHANASNHPSAAAARCKNIHQLSNYIETHSKDNAVIVMGDMNAHYCYKSDNIKDLLLNNGLKDAWVVLNKQGQLPKSIVDLPSDEILSITDTCESIDKILFRNIGQILLKPSYYQVPKALFSDKAGRPLSDHHPVSLSFTWKLREKALTPELSKTPLL